MSIKPNDQYTSNLTALRQFLPDLADRVDAEPIPAHVTEAIGRDGCPTFRLAGDDGGVVWFGRSSMPSVSAPGWVSGFASDGGHVLLPGIHTGLEPIVLADRVPSHAAVFVAEPKHLAIKLAFHLYDYVDLLRTRRLVLVDGASPADGFRSLAESHPGFDLPTQLVPLPDWTESDVRTYQEHLTQAGGAVHEVQARALTQYQKYASARGIRTITPEPAIAVLSLDPSFLTCEEGARIERAAASLGWRCAPCLPNAPDCGNVVARLRCVQQVDADLALFVNSPAGRFDGLAAALPIVYWFPSAVMTGTCDGSDAGRAHKWFAGSRTIAASFQAAGVPSDSARMLAPGADPMCAEGDDLVTSRSSESAPLVALIGNLPDDTAASAGIGLASQVKLWRAMQDECRDRADSYHEERADTMVRAAQDKSGVHLQDNETSANFARLLVRRIAPVCMARMALDVVRNCRVSFRAWGSHWRVVAGEEQAPTVVPIPHGCDRRAALAEAVLIILPTVGPEAVQAALDALAMGRRVAWRWTKKAFICEFPALNEIAPFVNFFQTRAELAALVADLAFAPAASRTADREAMALVRSEHSVVNRLRTLIGAMHSAGA